jgi:PAS domain S-box-containing protein
MSSKKNTTATGTSLPNDYVPKILVVDDEQRIRDACKMILEEDGYDVMTASDGTKGVDLITAHHFDIILLDLMMPTLSGFDVLANVKSLHPDTVVIVITGYATLEHSVESMKKGAFDFLPKPFTPDHLRVIISKALDHTMALRDIANTSSRLRTMVNRLSDGVMCSNRQQSVVFANPAFLFMLGCRPGLDTIGRPVGELVVDTRIRELIKTALQMDQQSTGEVSNEITLPPSNASGERIIDVRCLPFRDRSGINIGVITVLHDITAARRMDQMKSDFVSMVSHEIRSPMNSVLMQLQVIMDGLAGEVTEKQLEILQRASMKIQSLSQMTSELLDLASIESGLTVQKKEPISMDELIREQIQLHLPQVQSQSIELTAELPDDVPLLLADRRNMEEVLSNLITNAIKYTPAGGKICLGLSIDGNYLCIKVSDTGYGITEDEKEKIFERFYRVKNQQTRHIQGTGLGLAIVKSLIEAHQGRIEVDSRPDKGSTFSVYLPVL